MSAPDIHFLIHMRDQIKLYHWQTESYSRHKATDNFIGKIDGLIDSYVEVYIGKYGRPRLTASTHTFKLLNLSDAAAERFVKICIDYVIRKLVPQSGRKAADTDLLNMRDEILAELNQLLYLFSLA